MPKFKNLGEPIKIRIGKLDKCYWDIIRKNEIVDVSFKRGKRLGLTEVTLECNQSVTDVNQELPKLTEGQIGDKKVETKQIDTDDFFKELIKIKGIGKKTAKDIIKVFPTKEKLIEAISHNDELPFYDDIEKKLEEKYGRS